MEKIKKIFSSGHEKDDDVLYDDPSAKTSSGGASHLPTATGGADHATEVKSAHGHAGKENDLRRQALDNESSATTSTPAAVGHSSSRPPIADNVSTASIRSGIVGGNPSHTGTSSHAGGLTGSAQHSALPDRTATDNQRSFPLGSGQTTSGTGHSHHGAEAALAGGAGAAGVGAYEANKLRNEPTTTSSGSDRHLPFDPTHHEHKGRGHGFSGDPCGPGDEHKTVGGIHHVPGPHSTDIANLLDPHVPGEFPNAREAGNLHQSSTTAQPIGGSTTERSFPLSNAPAGTTSAHTSTDHHLGRDAAIAGGAGAAGLGAHGAGSHQHGHDALSHTPGRFEDQRFDPAAGHGDKPTHIPDLTRGGQESQQQHHYGRDAAVAGGAGAAGVGAYEVGKHRAGPKAEDPASYTTGPHKSNVLNVIDPRVQPEPEKMKTRETAGPHNSDALNRADPRVDSDLSKQNPQHHYGRDAAVAGTAGAVGYGGYEASKAHHAAPAATSNTTSAPYGSTTASSAPYGSTTANTAEPGYGSASRQDPQHHYGRDAAVAGGAGAAGYGAYEAIDSKHEKERLKEAEKAQKHQQKAHEKEAEKAQKHRQKAYEKEVEKGDKKHHKELEHAEKEHEKGEKKHSVLGFLHRDKNLTEEERNLQEHHNYREADQLAHERHQRELEAASAAGTVPVAGAKFEPSLAEQHAHPDASAPQYISVDEKGHHQISTGQDGRHRLHKDPPSDL